MADIEQDIRQLEELLRELEKGYDAFFSGLERTPPTKAETAVQSIVRAYGVRPIQNSGLAFRLKGLTARYNSMKQVWARRLRAIEEGRGPAAQRPVAPHPQLHVRPPTTEYITANPQQEAQRIQHLFDSYRHLRQECGESTEKLKAESFQRALAEKVQKIKEAHRVDSVLIRLVKDGGKTKIVAKPFRRRPQPGTGETP
jgi:hypothetical protein